MGEEFNFTNSDNDDHFWKLNSPNSPNSDGFDTFKFDFTQQSIDSFLEPEFNFDSQNNQYQQIPDITENQTPQDNPDTTQFLNSEFIVEQTVPNNFAQNNIEQLHQVAPNQQFNQFYDHQMGLSTQSNTNFQINHQMNQMGTNLNIGTGLKGNSNGMIPTISHRRTPSTPSNLLNFNGFAFNQLPQQTQLQPQTHNQQAQKLNKLTPTQIQQMQQIFGHDLTLPQNRNRKMSSQPLPIVPTITTSADEEFNTVCRDPEIKFNPHKLGFIPTKFWPDKEFTFGELVTDFFQRKNNANSRFYHKLYNALKISEDDPFYSEYLGIEWVNNNVLKVDKKKFARLLNIKTIDGSLFHQQGNFPSHGFIELGTNDALKYVTEEDLDKVDYENVRLLVHQAGVFVRGCTEDAIEGCKWVSSRKRH